MKEPKLQKENFFLKSGRILFYLLVAYFFILPALSIFLLLPIACSAKGASEFCGIWIFVIFPHLNLLYCGYDECFNSLPLSTIGLLLMSAGILILGLKYSLKRWLKFELGYHWTLVFTALLTLMAIIVLNKLWYPYSVKDTYSWSEKTIESSDTSLCTDKLDNPNDQTQCLYMAAIKSGDLKYCGALEEFQNKNDTDEYYEFDTNECLVDIQIIKNFSAAYCDGDYSYDCLREKCSYDQYDCSTTALNGHMMFLAENIAYKMQDNSVYDTLYESVDTNLCSFYSDLPSSTTEDIDDCYINIYGTYVFIANHTKDPISWCDKIDPTNETFSRFSEQCYENLSN